MRNEILAAIIIATQVLLPGCLDGPETLPDYTVWEVPQWTVGQYWAYEYESGGTFRMEVSGLENYNGKEAYKLEVVAVDPRLGILLGKRWIAVDDLATIGHEFHNTRVFVNCGGVFPLENRSFPCFIRVDGRPDPGVLRDFAVIGPTFVDTPAGRFPALEYTVNNAEGEGNYTERHWYSDAVGYWVQSQVQDDPMMYLTDWGSVARK